MTGAMKIRRRDQILADRRYRLARSAVLCFSLGILLTVAVAWAAVLLALDPKPGDPVVNTVPLQPVAPKTESRPDPPYILCVQLRRPGFTRYALLHLDFNRESYEIGDASDIDFPVWMISYYIRRTTQETEAVDILRAGWPFHALGGYKFEQANQTIEYGLWNIPGSWTVKILPLNVIWSGFILNSLIFGALIWTTFRGPFVLRRQLRIKRGRCAHCGYRLQGLSSNRCPECGARIAQGIITS